MTIDGSTGFKNKIKIYCATGMKNEINSNCLFRMW